MTMNGSKTGIDPLVSGIRKALLEGEIQGTTYYVRLADDAVCLDPTIIMQYAMQFSIVYGNMLHTKAKRGLLERLNAWRNRRL